MTETNVIQLRPSQAEMEAAWDAYDVAQRRVVELYQDAASTSPQRRAAVIEANRLHSTFRKLCDRGEGR